MAISSSPEVAELLEYTYHENLTALEAHYVQRRNEVGEEPADLLFWTGLIATILRSILSALFGSG
jgi:NTP pyrophosphatase (non-canonical NTP hydrolase)